MAKNIRYLLNRDGRYFARIVFPPSFGRSSTTKPNFAHRSAPTDARRKHGFIRLLQSFRRAFAAAVAGGLAMTQSLYASL